jgi:hypothetical protein
MKRPIVLGTIESIETTENKKIKFLNNNLMEEQVKSEVTMENIIGENNCGSNSGSGHSGVSFL